VTSETLVRVLFLTRYTATGPSSRYRVVQFLPYLERAGIAWTLQPLVDDRYLAARFSGRRPGVAYLAGRALRRVAALLRAGRFDVVFVQKDLFPWAPPIVEWILSASGARVILDIDDAIHLPYAGRRGLRGKVPAAIARATRVLAGNRWLADYARQFNPNTVHFPTVVDAERFTPRSAPAGGAVVVGWMGSPETAGFLADLAPAIARAQARTDFVLRVIGAERFEAPGVRAEARAWSFDREVDDLRGFDVGVMPLRDDAWARGKCSLKLLQYMSAGLATVSSPVGSVGDIVRDGDNGFVAATADAWTRRLSELAVDTGLRARAGARARAWLVANYSLANYGPRLVEHIRAAAEGRGVTHAR
jgi:glycosyltransferase involved in cell wall biosynthesis